MTRFLGKGKVTFNKSGSGSISAKLNLPVFILNYLEINKDERDIEFILKDGSIIIQKKSLSL